MDRFELRRHDYSLSGEQRQLISVLRDFLSAHCPPDVVRAAGPLGYDPALWDRLGELGLARMGLPAALGGAGASLVDLVLVAEELGRAAAPVPFADHAAASRLLSRYRPLAAPQADWDEPIGFGVREPGARGHLIPGGAVTRSAIVLAGPPAGPVGSLELWRGGQPAPAELPLSGLPAAWWACPGDRSVLATGDEAVRAHGRARTEWKLLTAATLIGLAGTGLAGAVEFAKTRYTRGVPVGTLQGISHPLADIATALVSGRHLLYRATWMLENEPGTRPDLAPAACAFAARATADALETAVHVQGGLGFTLESDVSLYFLRARGLIAAGGDPGRDVLEVVDGLDAIRRAEPASRGAGTETKTR
ncbi:MAG: acyl-CoA/acyl-ACP dehydrogenase [Streptosporangiales bacterium]|nr:acyl-CoA/acyl-ACP dehydrogenase [Streptosporangiales bacterium]